MVLHKINFKSLKSAGKPVKSASKFKMVSAIPVKRVPNLNTIRVSGVTAAKREIADRRSAYPRMIHKADYHNRGLYISSYSINDYIDTYKRQYLSSYKSIKYRKPEAV